jgi:hypothetical protein
MSRSKKRQAVTDSAAAVVGEAIAGLSVQALEHGATLSTVEVRVRAVHPVPSRPDGCAWLRSFDPYSYRLPALGDLPEVVIPKGKMSPTEIERGGRASTYLPITEEVERRLLLDSGFCSRFSKGAYRWAPDGPRPGDYPTVSRVTLLEQELAVARNKLRKAGIA